MNEGQIPAGLQEDNAELRIRLRELEETLQAIHSGDVDALIVNNDIYVLESASASTNRLRQDVLGQMQDAVLAFDNQDNIIYLNAAAERQYGVVSSEVLGRPKEDVFAEFHGMDAQNSGFGELPDDLSAATVLATHGLPDGLTLHVESRVSSLIDATGQVFGSLSVVRDVTQRHRAEVRRDGLVRLTDRLRDLDDLALVGLVCAETLGEILQVSRVGYGIVDHDAETLHVESDWAAPGVEPLVGKLQLRDFGSFVDGLKRNQLISISDVRQDQRTRDAAVALETMGARSLVKAPVLEHGRLVAILYVNHRAQRDWQDDDLDFIRDVAERTRASTERIRNVMALRASEARLRQANENLEAAVLDRTRELVVAEEALRQSQKMEAVGQLTGGIAHDFNNMLGAMSTSLQVLRVRLSRGNVEGFERYLTMAQESIKRAAALTQRMLAFARRQTLDSKPTDVNRLITGLVDLIRRSAGPHIALEVVCAEGLWVTRIDPSQLENALLNLCINARDAMLPGGGRLTVETANERLGETAAAQRDLPAGHYISVCVTDTGAGMLPEVKQRVFDPFFTTKPLGQGTGLGLSMVYGFVRQSGGQVHVVSEPGQGTAMRVYLPRHVGVAEQATEEKTGPLESGDGETVLVIEDEATIRVLIAEVLHDAGYKVVTAPDGPSGLRILQSSRRVDLVVTDVGLPGGLNGRQVADAARVTRPDLKILFITGYAESAAVGEELLDHGMQVLSKPFEVAALTRKVRDMTLTGG